MDDSALVECQSREGGESEGEEKEDRLRRKEEGGGDRSAKKDRLLGTSSQGG